ncbi:MAG TPA: hypothetical protein VL866_21670 [Pyrinomonadaceae bacterium]|nr:hypothetical protein [Pyrinomonadaceae bacterium]
MNLPATAERNRSQRNVHPQHLAVGLNEQQAGVVVMTNSGNGLGMCIRTTLSALGATHMTYTLSFS